MAKIKLTQTELKKQKDQLKTYARFLPTLQVKKQLLQKELLSAKQRIRDCEIMASSFWKRLEPWVGCFAEDINLGQLVSLDQLDIEYDQIAGVEIPKLKSLKISILPYDLYETPLWTDQGLIALEELVTIETEVSLALEAEQKIAAELQITSQRVNLFEKIKIPQVQSQIKKITVYLDDQAASAVGWARGAKKKLAERQQIEEAL